MEFIKFCFDPRGRTARLAYFTAYVWCVALFCLSFLLQDVFYAALGDGTLKSPAWINLFYIVLTALYILPVIVLIIITIKRFRDIKMSGFAILFLLVPFLNIYYQFILFFRKGPSPFSDTFLKEYGF